MGSEKIVIHLLAFPFPPHASMTPCIAIPAPPLFRYSAVNLNYGVAFVQKFCCRTITGTGCWWLWFEHVSLFPQMLPRSEWDYKRGSRGSQVSTVHTKRDTQVITIIFKELNRKHTQKLVPWTLLLAYTHLINDANSKNATTNRPVHPLVVTLVKQHVQRCHFPPESLLYSFSLNDAGQQFSWKVQHKPLKARGL